MKSWNKDLKEIGIGVIPNVFSLDQVMKMREVALDNLQLMSNTRPTATSRHLPGFHRFPQLASLHDVISTNSIITEALHELLGKDDLISIGLTDITINRSQPWHTDLLRGEYRHYLDGEPCWSSSTKPCVKVLVYLQDSGALQVVPKSHFQAVDLSSDDSVEPGPSDNTTTVAVNRGDVVLMDIRLIHRGSSEEQMASKCFGEDAKILVSTVFGSRFDTFCQSMLVGNAKRMVDWDNLHGIQTRHGNVV